MSVKQKSLTNKKEGEITRSERTSVNQQAELVLKNIKEKSGAVVRIAITNRTTIELSAYLSQTEVDARVENYLRLHASKI